MSNTPSQDSTPSLDAGQIGLLGSAIDITRRPDRRTMERSLLAAIIKHTPFDRTSLIDRPRSQTDVAVEALALERAGATNIHDWSYNRELGALAGAVDVVIEHGKTHSLKSGGQFIECIPLLESQKVISVLVVQWSQDPSSYVGTVIALLRIYGNYLTIVKESESDKLTGLLNRRTFDGKFQQLVTQQGEQATYDVAHQANPQKRVRRRLGHSWLGIIDIDHFKGINDQFGHIYGDEILLLLSGHMQQFFRRADLLFRFGGEEFVVLLEPTDKVGAAAAFSRFRELVANFEFPQVSSVTISIGFAPINADSISTDVFGRADQALYYAKNHGRNQVADYLHLIESDELKVAAIEKNIDLF